MARDLNIQQTAFLSHYLGDCRGIGNRAARAAGYNGNDAALRVKASQLLTHPVIAAAVSAYKEQLEAEGIANRTNRIAAQQERWLAIEQIRRERAEDRRLHGIPGAATGYIVKRFRGIGGGEDFQLVEEYVFDKTLHDAAREVEQQAAKELGQASDKADITLTRRYIGVDVDEV